MHRLTAFAAATLLATLMPGCAPTAPTAPAGNEASAKRVAALEKEVALLKERDRDVRAKIRVSHGWGNSPVEDFLATDFWECTYDSGWSDCASRCSAQTSAGYRACLLKPEGPERVRCITENSARGSACLKACPTQGTPTPPTC